MPKTCVLLVGHGSRDSAARIQMEKLTEGFQSRHPSFLIRHGFLEHSVPSFADQLEKTAAEFDAVEVLPLFLFHGSHLTRDIPEILQTVQKKYPDTRLRLAAALGATPMLAELVWDRLRDSGYPERPNGAQALIVGHGTREPESQALLDQLIALIRSSHPSIRIEPCFIGLGRPSLVEKLSGWSLKDPAGSLWVMPYLLFPGVFEQKIIATLSRFQSENSGSKIFRTPLLGANEFIFQTLDRRLSEKNWDGNPQEKKI